MSTTNFERFKQTMDKAKAKKAAPASPFTWMKLDNGKRYNMRFLPLKSENLEMPIALYHHHTLTFPDGHFESITCAKRLNDEPCPFCDQASALYRKFTKTDNIAYKNAAKDLFPKLHYLMVGYEKDKLDVNDLKATDIKIVRVSSQSNKELIEAKLTKGIDFVDFAEGRDMEIIKNKPSGKDTFSSIVYDFGDKSPAFEGKSGKALWEKLLDLSPDLTPIVSALPHEKLMEKFNEFMSAPTTVDDSDLEEERNTLINDHSVGNRNNMKPQLTKKPEVVADDDVPFDISDMRAALEDN